MEAKLNALVICTTAPDASTEAQTGSTIWSLQLVQLLAKNHRITLLTPPPVVDPYITLNKGIKILNTPLDVENSRFIRLFKSLKRGIFPSVWSLYSSETVRYVKNIKPNKYDVCWLLDDYCGVYMEYIPSCLPTIYCRHYVIHNDFKAISLWHGPQKLYRKCMAFRFDRNTVSQATAVISPTIDMRNDFLNLVPQANLIVFPTKPFNTPPHTPLENIKNSTRKDGKIVVTYLGDMQFIRNYEGVRWFLTSVLPLLESEIQSKFHFKFIGRLPPNDILTLGKSLEASIEFTGFVESLNTELEHSQIAIIPVWGGSGIRLKTLTLIASGLPIVSTPDALEGIDLKDQDAVMIGNTPEKFARALEQLLNPGLRLRISTGSTEFSANFFNSDQDSNTLLKISKDHISSLK